MADQWNLFFWLEWVSAGALCLYHILLLFPRGKRPTLASVLVAVPALGLSLLLVFSLIRPSFRWPMYPILILTLIDIAFVLLTLKDLKKRGASGTGGVLRLLGASGLLVASLAAFGLVTVFPAPPIRPGIEVSMARLGDPPWLRLLREPGGRGLRWFPEAAPVLDDYLVHWSVPRLDDGARNTAPAVLVLTDHGPWEYRLLLEDLAQAGFEVWTPGGLSAPLAEEEPGWGPPQSWNWIRWPEFLSRLATQVQNRWRLEPAPAARLPELATQAARLAGGRGKSIQAVVLVGQWEGLEGWSLPAGVRVLVRWGGSDLPRRGGGVRVLTLSPILAPRAAGVDASATFDGALAPDLSDAAVLRPWLGLPPFGMLGHDAGTRYAVARDLARRFLQVHLLQGDPQLFQRDRMDLPGRSLLQGSP